MEKRWRFGRGWWHSPWSGSGGLFSKRFRAVVASAMMKADECWMWCSMSRGRRDGYAWAWDSGSNPEPPLAVTSLSEVSHERLPGNRYIQKPGHCPSFTGVSGKETCTQKSRRVNTPRARTRIPTGKPASAPKSGDGPIAQKVAIIC